MVVWLRTGVCMRDLGLQGECPPSGGVVMLKTGKREMPGSNPSRTCQPSHSEFTAVFSEIRVNTNKDPLERPTRTHT